MLKRISLFIILLSVTACATSRGFNRGELREQMNGKMEVTDADIAKALTTKAQLPKPFKLGIYFKEAQTKHSYADPKWRWSGEDKDRVLALANKMKAAGEISDAFVVSDAVVSDTDLRSLRLAAAKHGADALMVVSGINDVDSYTNNWGWTYIALAPALFVPASVNDSLFMARATMWDVRNEFLYMSAEAESTKSQTRPAAFANDRKITEEAKEDAMNKLDGEITNMIGSLSAAKGSSKNL